MPGVKTLVNNSRHTIEVTLIGRRGSDPNGGDLPPVTVKIPAGGTAPYVRYGDDRNPFLNALEVRTGDRDSCAQACLRVTQRGGPGTLDDKFNANRVFKIASDPDEATFMLEAGN